MEQPRPGGRAAFDHGLVRPKEFCDIGRAVRRVARLNETRCTGHDLHGWPCEAGVYRAGSACGSLQANRRVLAQCRFFERSAL